MPFLLIWNLHAHYSIQPSWNIPYPRNPFFTGCNEILSLVYHRLQQNENGMRISKPQALTGLGGIGKTQVAIEYAYRHFQDYHMILWASAETRETFITGYITIATQLNLPEMNNQNQEVIVQAVLQWLSINHEWLLILDNANDLTVICEFIPSSFNGHVLITTQAQAMGGLAYRIEVPTMENDIGALFLLRRAGFITQDDSVEAVSPDDFTHAVNIVQEMGGLPLALDQAGAYMEEMQVDLVTYWSHYQS